MIKKLLTILLASSFVISLIPLNNLSAQSVSPTTQPLVQQGDMVYLGKIIAPAVDGTGRANGLDSLDYGAFGLGMGPDGASLYFGCHDWYDQVARFSIPAIGGTGTIQMPCTAVTNKIAVNPGDVNGINPGGYLVWNNKLIVTMYPYYDASHSAVGSHFTMSTNMTSQAGPYRVGSLTGSNSSPTDRIGMQSGYMGIIPSEWRSLLGAPAFTGQMGIPIISRTSFGPSFTTFDPDQLGVSSASTKLLLGYPNEYQTMGGYSQANTNFSGADQLGGAAFPAGTRSVLFVGRHATTFCYGEGTNDPTLDRQPVPGWNGAVIYCYDPTSMNKGTHGYPYIHQVWAYDANDLLAVKNGTKNPWDLRPYATWKLSDINNNGAAPAIVSATFDPVTKRFYMATGRDIHVYQVNVGTSSPTPPTADLKINGSDSTVNVNTGTAITLSWSSTNASSCSVTGGYSGTSGTQSITPTVTTTYTLSCTGSGGSASDSVTVNVNSTTVQLPTADIKANGSDGPISVPATSGVTLTWTSTNATSCSINPGGYTGLSGTQNSDAIEAGRTFTLSCTGAGGTRTDSVVVNPSSSTITDTTKPTVSITYPTSGASVEGSVNLTANATDNVSISGVQFIVDGANYGSEDTVAPYSLSIDTLSLDNGTHTVSATARDSSGNTNTATALSFTVSNTIVDVPTAPATPTSLTAVAVSPSQITITWNDNSTSESGYRIERKVVNSTDFAEIITVGSNTTSFQDMGLSASTQYSYRVRAYNTAGNSDYSNESSTSTQSQPVIEPPAPPTPPVVSIKLGDKVKTTSAVYVRRTPGGRILGTQNTGKQGTVIDGPQTASGLKWWKVNFTSGVDGWTADKYLAKVQAVATNDEMRNQIANLYILVKELQDRLSKLKN